MASVLILSSWKRRVPGRGILFIPVYLIPCFLLVPYFYFSFCVAKADEISELFLGAAVLIWTIDHLYKHRYLKKKGIGLIAIHELEKDTVNASAKHYKRLATAYSLNEYSLNANRYYQKSMRIDSSHLFTLTDDNEKAEILLSISESMAMNHDFSNALLKANVAKHIANTPVLRMKIEKWLQRLLENRQSGETDTL